MYNEVNEVAEVAVGAAIEAMLRIQYSCSLLARLHEQGLISKESVATAMEWSF